MDEKKTDRLHGIRHIAFIMDGNGRWAKAKGQPREFGHKAGAQAFRRVVTHCRDIGMEYVTVYAFSTENWKRPRHEVSAIMRLLDSFLDEFAGSDDKNNMTVRFIGDMSDLSERLRRKIAQIEAISAGHDRVLNIALNYGGRAELVNAFNTLVAEGVTHITEADVSRALYTAGCPDPDLIVRTAGEYRLSNFLLWQASYSELYVTDVLWPDFGPDDVDRAIEEYGKRHRNFGGVVN